ncbi:competence/damage-inducible protein A [Lacticaseibacillus chiayiensis]|uniref:Putative competence-damage inducible protein n=1 Tax=Lacticaseibacillus chiayiensis TaxID=2100821 RepID=A0A4Q1TR15_9LACO|nr:competence/damage-inducible protein A [Lacticaseibacillus chiayiensis]QVI35436.1 competence/damage-inducible protein A [Lacticaseibacillus chiayiensis]RXT21349.1 competence/damage-inducible protein A [Lacticaseibacillus chiayiensis]
MQAEIIAVGTEILMGQITNTNGAYMAKQLAALGIASYHQQVVGDNAQRLADAISLAEKRSDIVILIGGLGPTPDDLTKQTLASHLNLPLVEDADAMAKLTARVKQQQRPMTPNNKLQAMYPQGADVLVNRVGLAVGAWIKQKQHAYVLLPGPPKEFVPMVDHELLPHLAKYSGHHEVLVSRVMRFFGIGESQLVTDLGDLIAKQTNPTLATYIKDHEVTIRVTASGKTQTDADAKLEPVIGTIMDREGRYFYGYGDDNSLVKELVKALAATDKQITAAESLTAGEFQAALGDVPGVSSYFKGGFVTYSLATKAAFLNIDARELAAHGVVSEFTAKAMAEHARQRAAADIAVSFTGVAGPDTLEGQPAGTVWIGLARLGQAPIAQVYHFPGGRNDVRKRAVMTGMMMALRSLRD